MYGNYDKDKVISDNFFHKLEIPRYSSSNLEVSDLNMNYLFYLGKHYIIKGVT